MITVDEALGLARRLGDPRLYRDVVVNQGMLGLERGKLDVLRNCIDQTTDLTSMRARPGALPIKA